MLVPEAVFAYLFNLWRKEAMMRDLPEDQYDEEREYDERYQAMQEDEQTQRRWNSIFGWLVVVLLVAVMVGLFPLPDFAEPLRMPARIVAVLIGFFFIILTLSGDEDEY